MNYDQNKGVYKLGVQYDNGASASIFIRDDLQPMFAQLAQACAGPGGTRLGAIYRVLKNQGQQQRPPAPPPPAPFPGTPQFPPAPPASPFPVQEQFAPQPAPPAPGPFGPPAPADDDIPF